MNIRLRDVDRPTLVPAVTLAGGTVLAVLLLVGLADRVEERPFWDPRGIPSCPNGAEADLLSSAALQCWFDAPHGRWRTLSHVSVHGAVVIQVEAADLVDAEDIGRRFVANSGEKFFEILVYVRRKSSAPTPQLVRRVGWTRQAGLATLDFTSPPIP
jgi:hypothetical protein